jgi:aryl-alcohol dehydrogenase-like predicted oxidoreductase
MEYRTLGRTGLRVSPLAVGTVNFSWLTNEANSFEILDFAREAGVNFIDTANNYNAGASEALLGRWFKQGDRRREDTVLASKVYLPPHRYDTGEPLMEQAKYVGPNEHRLSAKNIRHACEASLKRLNTDYIDIYQMHHIDRAAPWEEVWQAMELLVAQGKVLYIGSSNFAGWHIAQANETATRRNALGLVSEQTLYNLHERTAELEVIPACEDYGMAFLPWSPLAAGQLAGLPQQGEVGRRTGLGKAQASEPIRKYHKLCDELGLAPADVALAWLLANPVVTAPVVGPRTLAQFKANTEALAISLDGATLAALDEIFPGPGPAPEAYAW